MPPPTAPSVPPPTAAPVAMPRPAPTVSALLAQPPRPIRETDRAIPITDLYMDALRSKEEKRRPHLIANARYGRYQVVTVGNFTASSLSRSYCPRRRRRAAR